METNEINTEMLLTRQSTKVMFLTTNQIPLMATQGAELCRREAPKPNYLDFLPCPSTSKPLERFSNEVHSEVPHTDTKGKGKQGGRNGHMDPGREVLSLFAGNAF